MDGRCAFILLAALALAACSDRQSAPVPGADLITGKASATRVVGVIMELSPDLLRTCEHPDGRMVAKVCWNAKSAGAKSVTIWVSDRENRERSWHHGKTEGTAETGPWVGDGTVFRMTDSKAKGRTLAEWEVHAVDCTTAKPEAPPSPASP